MCSYLKLMTFVMERMYYSTSGVFTAVSIYASFQYLVDS